ncbi:MAG: Aspartyl-tRNA(Asn) amidotransferase subunit A [Candidatus Methanosuratincola subterraneus]|uniref:Glutamyl-tRNA(Gln) amidotransferase subunit A n=1 Tax=Methanosuratincola subterraneus TaxID=2593994 RepID=A0A3S3S0P5_METS7|nr:MAG: Aspartyl-tRNA(Asn) amidotransferase subunit A [Candidatus Methanosuratincola subterraneus]
MARLEEMTLFEAVEGVRGGLIEREELFDAFLQRIRRLNPEYGAFITVNEVGAEKGSGAGGPNGSVEGAPIAVKDCICTKGVRTTCGSKILKDYVPPYDATVVSRIKSEGGRVIGKTNMDEFAMGSSTENSGFFVCRNPWDKSRVPGGSSGGSAVAVSARMALAALGSDTGGSVRCPASFCGIVAMKATYGLVSRYGLVAYANSLEQIGPMTRDVRDCALLLNVISGHDPRDCTTIPGRKVDYLEFLEKEVKGLRIGVPREFFGEGTDRGVEREVWNGIHALEGLGASWHDASLPSLKYALPAYYIIAMSEASSNLARFDGMRYGTREEDDGLNWEESFSKTRGANFGSEVKRRIILGTFALSSGYYEEYYLNALKARTLIRRDFERLFKEFDVLVGPTMPTPAFRIGEKVEDPLEMYMSDIDTVSVNLAGIPAISVPCGFANGLPVGLQIMGPPLGEGKVITAARRLEEELGLELRPPV